MTSPASARGGDGATLVCLTGDTGCALDAEDKCVCVSGSQLILSGYLLLQNFTSRGSWLTVDFRQNREVFGALAPDARRVPSRRNIEREYSTALRWISLELVGFG